MVFYLAILSCIINTTVTDIRSTYKEAINSSAKADKLVKMTESSKSNAVHRAYYGTGLALQAKHSWNPATKLSKASDASKELNTAVSSSNSDLEVRFLRFSFEANAPSFLDLSAHTAEDKKWILSHKNTSHPMWSVMKEFLKTCTLLTEAEKKQL